MMPIRFPTEAANDPDGKLQGMPESAGKDDIDALRGRARGIPDRRERPDKEPRREQTDQPPPGKDSGDK